MDAWIKFQGKIEKASTGFRLTDEKGGIFEVSNDSVRTDDKGVALRVGSKIKMVAQPKEKNRSPSPPDAEMKAMGDCDRTACIGLVEICCGSGKVLRACIGAWGC
jgi:hypothetical protein